MDHRSEGQQPVPILVTGGTGTLGRLVVSGLRAAGRSVRVLSRGRRERAALDGVTFATADLATGDGVEAAVAGTTLIVHCAGSAKGDDEKTRRLVAAARQQGVRHVVLISVVGADQVPMTGRIDRAMFGYFGAKHASEQIVAASGIPWTTLRATQFYDLSLATVAQMSRLPVIPVPSGFRFQPLDAAEVANRLVELALGTPSGRVPDMGGPRVYDMADMVRSYLRATGRHRLIVPVHIAGQAAAAIRAGANLGPDRAVGQRTWEDFLAERTRERPTPTVIAPADRP